MRLLYPVFKYGLFVWVCHLLFRPRIEGRENIPKTGPAILVSNHISATVPYAFDVVHVNSEFATQASDHEPQVARLKSK